MTREEHIARAEELLAGPFNSSSYPGGKGYHGQPTDRDLAMAQVHAALAAAMAPEVPPRRSWWFRGGEPR